MKTIKLNNNQTELVLKAISAFIREEERELTMAEEIGLNTNPYRLSLNNLRELKQVINNQIN